ncbi:MAG: branched-chain amino acid ABC transporter substrate-binding protein, partial [Verrucomicrobia bacterium]
MLAGRIAFPLFFLSAGPMLVQPCAGAPFGFENTGSLTIGRFRHTATLLPNGTVLVAGGGDFASTSAELYDPAIGTWKNTGSLIHGHVGATATLLPNGKVLIVGGYDGNFPRRYAELYDPA